MTVDRHRLACYSMIEQLNIGIGHQNFFRLNIRTSDIGRFTRIGRSLVSPSITGIKRLIHAIVFATVAPIIQTEANHIHLITLKRL